MEFINAFMQQFVLFLAYVILAAVAVFIGITVRKHKNKKEEQADTQASEEAAAE